MALCLALVFSVSPVEAAPKEDTARKCNDGKDNDKDGLIDTDDPECSEFGDPQGGDPAFSVVLEAGDSGLDSHDHKDDMVCPLASSDLAVGFSGGCGNHPCDFVAVPNDNSDVWVRFRRDLNFPPHHLARSGLNV